MFYPLVHDFYISVIAEKPVALAVGRFFDCHEQGGGDRRTAYHSKIGRPRVDAAFFSFLSKVAMAVLFESLH